MARIPLPCLLMWVALWPAAHVASKETAFLASFDSKVQVTTVQDNLEAELAKARGQSAERRPLQAIENELRHLYATLPQDGVHGGLNQESVRYALHRFFVQRHSWYIRGLELPADGANVTASGTMLKDKVPAYALELLEQRLQGKGVGLRELAALAATLEDLIETESLGRLLGAYSVHQMSTETTKQILHDLALQTFMLMYLTPEQDFYSMKPAQVKHKLRLASKQSPQWEDIKLWMQDMQRSVQHGEAKENPFASPAPDFSTVRRTASRISREFAGFQQGACSDLKEQLAEKEIGDTGRVSLTDFYRGSFGQGAGQVFTESREYLKHLGVLDETNPRRPSVIIPNYVLSRANCATPSSYYAVCCVSECEALMARLERQVREPTADAKHLALLVSQMPSSSVEAPQNISTEMLARLNGIAQKHGGRVSLHSRLFAQWMHHAYPRECPFVHPTSTREQPMARDEWGQERGAADATKEQLEEIHISKVLLRPPPLAMQLPWNENDDESWVGPPTTSLFAWLKPPMRVLVFVLLASSTGLYLASEFKKHLTPWLFPHGTAKLQLLPK